MQRNRRRSSTPRSNYYTLNLISSLLILISLISVSLSVVYIGGNVVRGYQLRGLRDKVLGGDVVEEAWNKEMDYEGEGGQGQEYYDGQEEEGWEVEEGLTTLLSLPQLAHLTHEFKSQQSPPITIPLPPRDRDRLKRAAQLLKQRIILRLWLDDHGLIEQAGKLSTLGITSLEDAYWFEDVNLLQDKIGHKIIPMWNAARITLPADLNSLEALKTSLWSRILVLLKHQDDEWSLGLWGPLLLVTLSLTGFSTILTYFPNQIIEAKDAIMKYITSKFSLANNCKVEFDWQDNREVGETVGFMVKFFHPSGLQPYPISTSDNVLIEVKHSNSALSTTSSIGTDLTDFNILTTKFTPRISGLYEINILVDNTHVKGSPFLRTFLPSKIDPGKTVFRKQTSMIVCVVGLGKKLVIEPRDAYGNRCGVEEVGGFQLEIEGQDSSSKSSIVQFTPDYGECEEQEELKPIKFLSKKPQKKSKCPLITANLTLCKPGVFRGSLTYETKPILHNTFDIVVLNTAEASIVQKNVISSKASYEGRLLSIGNEVQNKPRKVWVSVTSKQLVVKEYLWKVVPVRVSTFRLSPNTKIAFLQEDLITIDDGSQPSVKLSMKDGKIVVAAFVHFLLRRIGGSETFQDKQEHFYKELRDVHRKHSRDKLTLKIDRGNLLESTYSTLKPLSSPSDYTRSFEISFLHEQGIDWGGLRREFFELISKNLFETSSMFTSMGDSRLVHPNPSSKHKLKYFEMAGRIVGKCLYESSLGSSYRQFVKAKFSRSFLAQLIGLRVSYRHFEQDDPELYLKKIKFILENDVEDMELFFEEEEYDGKGKLVKTIDLIPDGSKIPVTNENKIQYLTALAQYRLSTKVKPQVDAFLKGLNDIVPDELLSIFDENELELLMCGTSTYSITDLRSHHLVTNSSPSFNKILDWFWCAVGNFTEEEKARLLQFTTGSSQLPPGGFSQLSPLFQLSPGGGFGSLPTAHTCFSQLCLPECESYEGFERSLRIAIFEGGEGFGLV